MSEPEKKRPKRRRPESEFLSAFAKCWRAAGGYWYKIPDASGPLKRFANPRPYDANAAILKRIFVIEAKYCNGKSFSLEEMRPHQIPELKKAWEAGYHAYVLVCYKAMDGKVADFFPIESLLRAQSEGRKKLGSEEASLRVYARTKSEWLIEPQKIAAMTERACTDNTTLFPVKNS